MKRALLLVVLTVALLATSCGGRSDAFTEFEHTPQPDVVPASTTTVVVADALPPTTTSPIYDTSSIEDANDALDAMDTLFAGLGNELNGIALDLAADAAAHSSSD